MLLNVKTGNTYIDTITNARYIVLDRRGDSIWVYWYDDRNIYEFTRFDFLINRDSPYEEADEKLENLL